MNFFNTKYVGVSAEVNVYTPEIIIADSAGLEKNYEDQVLLILTATKKNRRDGRVHEPLEADITNLFNIKRIKEGIASMD